MDTDPPEGADMVRDPEVRDLLIESVKLIVKAEVVFEQLKGNLAQLTQVVIPHVEHYATEQERRVYGRRASDKEGPGDA